MVFLIFAQVNVVFANSNDDLTSGFNILFPDLISFNF